MAEASLRPVWAEIDLDAVRHNAGVMRRIAGPAALCAVVKADAYGHGRCRSPALRSKAAQPGSVSRSLKKVSSFAAPGSTAPVLVLSEPPPEAMAEAVANGLVPTVYTSAGIAAAESAARSAWRRSASARRAPPAARSTCT